jgi:hypothetical protein
MTGIVPALGRTRVSWLLGVMAVIMLASAFAAGTARAADPFFANLAGKTWTHGEFDSTLHFERGEVSAGPSAICVGPAQFSGSWKFPIGWDCSSTGIVTFEFASLSAYPAVDNPNSQSDSVGVLYS